MITSERLDEFQGFRPKLQSFVFRLLTNRHDAEDVVQETYLRVQQSIDSFKGDSSFKTWVFTIALNISKNLLAKRKRWPENAQDYGAMLHVHSSAHWDAFKQVFESTPEKTYEIREHIGYCFNCISKTLELNQQVCLLLKEVYEFKISEVMQITKLSEGVVKHAIADARKHMIRIFDDRCSFVSKRGVCHQCTTLKGNLNPKQDAHIEARKVKLVKAGSSPDKEYLYNLRLELVKNIDPLSAPNTLMNTFMLENCENWVDEGKKRNVLESRPKSTAHLSK